MALPVTTYDATNGSDTLASGAGPAVALTGSAAYSGDGAGGGTQTIIQLDGSPDLSGVNTDGSHTIWIDTGSTNRGLFKIVGKVAATSVTVQYAPTTAISSGGGAKSWAIGGERKTLFNNTSREDWLDYGAGWIQEFDSVTNEVYTDGEQQIVGLNSDTTSGPQIWRASSGAATKPIIDHAGPANTRLFAHTDGDKEAGGYLEFEGLHLRNQDSWVGANVIYATGTTDLMVFRDCKLSSAGASALNIAYTGSCILLGCEITTSSGDACVLADGSRPQICMSGCWVHSTHTTASAAMIDLDNGTTLWAGTIGYTVISSVAGNTGPGVTLDTNNVLCSIDHCTFYELGGNAIDTTASAGAKSQIPVTNSLFSEIGGAMLSGNSSYQIYEDWNAWFNITGATHTNVATGANSVGLLTGEPMTDPSNDDFTLNNTSGAGASCRAAGSPGTMPSATGTGYTDIGAWQHQDPAGGGGTTIIHHPRRIM